MESQWQEWEYEDSPRQIHLQGSCKFCGVKFSLRKRLDLYVRRRLLFAPIGTVERQFKCAKCGHTWMENENSHL